MNALNNQGRTGRFEIDSSFRGVRFEILDGNLIIKARECGTLSVALENCKKLAREIEYYGETYKGRKVV